jgi:hypothetical protein
VTLGGGSHASSKPIHSVGHCRGGEHVADGRRRGRDATDRGGGHGHANRGGGGSTEFAQPFVRQQVDEATLTLGRGFQVYTIAPERILKDRAGFSASCTPTDMWRFLVLDGERTVGLLTVAQVEGRWATVAFGGAQLAEEMQQVFATWTQETGYQIRFIRVYQATADFVEVSPGPGQAEFVPMTSGRIALNLDNRAFDPQQLLPERQVFPALVEQVATALGVEPELK